MTALATAAIAYDLGDDPAWAIRHAVNDVLADIKIGGSDVLVGVWEPGADTMTKGGILLPENARDNLYKHQGNVGLVLKLGPRAYKTEKSYKWFVDEDGEDDAPQVGEWVVFNFKQGEAVLIGKQKCQLVQDQYVLMRIPRPDLTL